MTKEKEREGERNDGYSGNYIQCNLPSDYNNCTAQFICFQFGVGCETDTRILQCIYYVNYMQDVSL